MNTAKQGIERIRKSIVQIVVSGRFPDGRLIERAIAGTGFFVAADQYIATAAHVFIETRKDLEAKGVAEISFGANILGKDVKAEIETRGTFLCVPLEIVSLDEENDVALARTPKKIGPTGLHLVAEGIFDGIKKRFELVEVLSAAVFGGNPEVGEEIAVAGFPLQVPYLVVQRGVIAATPTFPIQGATKEREEIVLDVMVNPGNSGGPVFGISSGSVVGVCRAHPLSRVVDVHGADLDAFQNAGLSFVTPVRYVRDLLDAQSIAYKVR